ncbi:MAG TPA: vitamin K epoxide reductase family protein [Gemmatimonadales bacterium]
MTRARKGIALLSLTGLFVAVYLYLYKIGQIGTLVCGTGACETVQLSPQSRFLGVEVALIGVVGYAVLLLLAVLSLQPRFAGPAWPSRLLAVLSGIAVLFTAYLTALELFVIHAICRYCVASAVIIVLLFLLAARELRRSAAPAA